jgi:hypothetical protein
VRVYQFRHIRAGGQCSGALAPDPVAEMRHARGLDRGDLVQLGSGAVGEKACPSGTAMLTLTLLTSPKTA